MATEASKEFRPVHDVVIDMLNGEYAPEFLLLLATLYERGAVCPPDAIEKLAEAFCSFLVENSRYFTKEEQDVVRGALKALEAQKEEQQLAAASS